ncbi:MAG: aspartate aminotransferase [Planctomycetota bacterium]|nr:MAG: aspartate aminotransferase [Planctomycetota bacterium]
MKCGMRRCVMRYAGWTSVVEPSATLTVVARVRQKVEAGVKVFNFGAGEPDFPTPKVIRDAAHKAIEEGKTRYTPAAGIPQLRQAFAERVNSLYGVDVDGENVVVTVGAKQALYAALRAVCEPNMEVIVPTPCWVTYPEMVKLAGGVPVLVETKAENGYVLDVEAIESAVTERTCAVIVNSPNNPTGAVYGREVLEGVVELARRHNLAVISDEVYDRLILEEGLEHTTLFALGRERVFSAFSCSKTYAMTGWRLGFGVGNKEWVRYCERLLAQSTSNACSVSQYAALAALLEGDEDAARMRREFIRRRNLMCRLLDKAGMRYVRPQGTFFLLLDVRDWIGGRSAGGMEIKDDETFAEALLEEASVAVVPGSPFHAAGRVRLSFACSQEDIEAGIASLVRFVESIRR